MNQPPPNSTANPGATLTGAVHPFDTAALAALEDPGYFQQACRRVVASRERLCAAMGQLGFLVLPSAANFIFARHPARPARELFAALRARGIIVRYFDRPRIDDYLRITIGTDPQCDELLSALAELLG